MEKRNGKTKWKNEMKNKMENEMEKRIAKKQNSKKRIAKKNEKIGKNGQIWALIFLANCSTLFVPLDDDHELCHLFGRFF